MVSETEQVVEFDNTSVLETVRLAESEACASKSRK